MLFTQQVFHLECLLLFEITSQSGVAYKNADYKKGFNVVVRSSKNEEITFPHDILLIFILYFIGTIFSENLAKSGGFRKNAKRGDGHIRGLSIDRGCKPLAH